MRTDPKKPQKKKSSQEPLQIADLALNKETVADLTEAQAERVKGGIRAGGDGDSGFDSKLTACCTTKAQGCP